MVLFRSTSRLVALHPRRDQLPYGWSFELYALSFELYAVLLVVFEMLGQASLWDSNG